MGFADPYLQKHSSFQPSIRENPVDDLKQIIVIPCYNEPGIIKSLRSLKSCAKPLYAVEVLIVVNFPANASEKIRDLNYSVYRYLVTWIDKNNSEKFRFFPLLKADIPVKHFGAGLARKIGMDEATYRFNLLDKKSGIIVSLDADTKCAQNYLIENDKLFRTYNKTEGCSIYFEHPVNGKVFENKVYEAAGMYELHLRYFKQGLKWIGAPYAFHTVGSAFAVTAGAYVKYGGMNRRKAAEDFYFIHKLTPHGNYRELNSTTVYPSSRPSDRVPFGTGASVKKLVEDDKEMKTYNLVAFKGIKELFLDTGKFFRISEKEINKIIDNLYKPLGDFLTLFDFIEKIDEINENVATLEAFKNRFFQKFNAFFVVKYMNFVHKEHLGKIPVNNAANDLLKEMGKIKKDFSDKFKLLEFYRSIERI